MIVRDRGFSIDLRGGPICAFTPRALRDEAVCAGLELPAGSIPTRPGQENIAVGLVRNPTTNAYAGSILIVHTTGAEDTPDQRAATAFSEKYARDLAVSLGAGAKPHAGSAYVETVRDTRVIRTTLDLDDVSPASEQLRAIAHHEVASVPTKDGSYAITILGRHEDAAILKAVCDESVATIVLSKDDHPGKDVSALVAQVMIGLATVIVLIVAFFVHQKSQRRPPTSSA